MAYLNKKRKLLVQLITVLLIMLSMGSAFATASDTAAHATEDRWGEEGKSTELGNDSLDQAQYDMGLRAEIEKSKTIIAEEEYHRASLEHRKNTFLWQYKSSRMIFGVVILIVLCGIVYAGIQFYQSIHEMRLKERQAAERTARLLAAEAAAKANAGTGDKKAAETTVETTTKEAIVESQAAATNIELSLSGIKVTSSLIGILILIISMAFFYLYLVYVYPIDQMKVDTEKQRQEMTNKTIK